MGSWIKTGRSIKTGGSNNTAGSNNTGPSVVPIALPNNTGPSVIVPIALVVAVIVPIAPILFSIARFGGGSQQGER
jgi:small neutral amino acid transporter SnatA (MarC family)